MKIKKKTAVTPFRETMAYRLLLAVGFFMAFLFSIYEMVAALQVSNTVAFVIALVIGVLCAIGIFFNLDRARFIPVPQRKRYR